MKSVRKCSDSVENVSTYKPYCKNCANWKIGTFNADFGGFSQEFPKIRVFHQILPELRVFRRRYPTFHLCQIRTKRQFCHNSFVTKLAHSRTCLKVARRIHQASGSGLFGTCSLRYAIEYHILESMSKKYPWGLDFPISTWLAHPGEPEPQR